MPKKFFFYCKTYCCKTRMYGTVKNAQSYMYYVAPETPMMSSVIADCPDLVRPQYFGQVCAYGYTDATTVYKSKMMIQDRQPDDTSSHFSLLGFMSWSGL